jgi:hypothetical protein
MILHSILIYVEVRVGVGRDSFWFFLTFSFFFPLNNEFMKARGYEKRTIV